MLTVAVALPQEPPTVFRAGVSEVRVDVQVVEGKQVIPNLGAADFEVFDEEQAQALLRFGRDSDPLSLVILVDVSGSMKKYVRQMSAAANGALQHLKPGDEVSIMLFARGTETVSDFSSNVAEIERDLEVGVEQHTLPSGTAIYGALLDAASALKEQALKKPNARRAVLILTDNSSLNYQITDAQVLEALFGADAVVNAIVTSSAERPKTYKLGNYRNPDFVPTDIFKIAEQTGGEALKVERADRAFPLMMERLRTRYSLVYRAPGGTPHTFRKIRVELSAAAKKRHGGAAVRARSGYYTPS